MTEPITTNSHIEDIEAHCLPIMQAIVGELDADPTDEARAECAALVAALRDEVAPVLSRRCTPKAHALAAAIGLPLIKMRRKSDAMAPPYKHLKHGTPEWDAAKVIRDGMHPEFSGKSAAAPKAPAAVPAASPAAPVAVASVAGIKAPLAAFAADMGIEADSGTAPARDTTSVQRDSNGAKWFDKNGKPRSVAERLNAACLAERKRRSKLGETEDSCATSPAESPDAVAYSKVVVPDASAADKLAALRERFAK